MKDTISNDNGAELHDRAKVHRSQPNDEGRISEVNFFPNPKSATLSD